MTCVLVIDDQPIVLNACRRVLRDAGVEIVIEARDLESGYRLYQQHRPDVVIVDLSMQGQETGGLSLIGRIRSKDTATGILVFSMNTNPRIVASALEAGASGYLPKEAPVEDLVKAVEQVQSGARYLNHELAVEVALLGKNPRQNPLADLTPRERQVLTLLSEGKPYAFIASQLLISYKTVVNTCHSLRQKLDVASLPALIRKAVELLGDQ
jgi:two-component system, NarL family, invasion response regulator UvrY